MRPGETKAVNQTASAVAIYLNAPGWTACLESRFLVFSQKVFWRGASWKNPSRVMRLSPKAFCVKNFSGGHFFELKPQLVPRFDRGQESIHVNRLASGKRSQAWAPRRNPHQRNCRHLP